MAFTLILLLLYSSLSAAEGQVPPPYNVRIVSHDLGLVLEWDPPQKSSERDFTYTAQYKGWQGFETVCMNKSSLSCDFSDEISAFGVFQFRVRTELDGKSSNWETTNNITLDSISLISAPDVKLQSRKGGIEIDITDPVLKDKNLRDYYHPVSYHIYYWIEGEAKKDELKSEQSKPILLDLTPKVRYCVQVEIVMAMGKTSLPSNETCILNSQNEDVKPWVIVVVLLVSFVVVLVSVVLIFFAVWYAYRWIRFLYPQAILPEHFKQYLSERPKMCLAMQHCPQPEERYHEVSIVPYVESPSASQNLQEVEGSDRIQPSANVSSKQEEAMSQEKKLCEHERTTDCDIAAREVKQSGDQDEETGLLLQ